MEKKLSKKEAFDDSAYLDFSSNASDEVFELTELEKSNALIQEIGDFLREQKLLQSELWKNVCVFFQGSQTNVTDLAITEPIREVMLFILENEHFNREIPGGNVFIEALQKLTSSFMMIDAEDDFKALNEIHTESIEESSAACSSRVADRETQAQSNSTEKEEIYKKLVENQKAVVSTICWKKFFYRALPVIIPSSIAILSKFTLSDINTVIEMSRNIFTVFGTQPETKKAVVEVTQELNLSDVYQAILREFMAYFNLKKDEK